MEEWAKKTEQLTEEEFSKLVNNLKKIRSNQISLEAVGELVAENGKKIQQLATLKIVNQQLIIRPQETKKIPLINQAVLEAQLGYRLGKISEKEVSFFLAPLTGEIRQQLSKKVATLCEQGKTFLRLSRQKVLKLLKEKKLSQNQQQLAEKEIEKVNEKYLKKVQDLQAKKTKELSW